MSPDQTALTLTRSCRECGADIPWDGKAGRPRVLCDRCRPSTWAPMRGSGINNPVSAPLSRTTDPETSRAAAAWVNGAAVEQCILDAYAQFGWLNADEVCNVLPECYPPTVRSAVTRLQKSKRLVSTGTKRPSNRGRPSIVWRLA